MKWGSVKESYLLIVDLDKDKNLMCVIEGFSVGHALEQASYSLADILFSNNEDLKLTNDEFKTIISKVRDGKINYKILKGFSI